jgi:hypothetical protein
VVADDPGSPQAAAFLEIADRIWRGLDTAPGGDRAD